MEKAQEESIPLGSDHQLAPRYSEDQGMKIRVSVSFRIRLSVEAIIQIVLVAAAAYPVVAQWP